MIQDVPYVKPLFSVSPALTTMHIDADDTGCVVSDLLKEFVVDSAAEIKESTLLVDVDLIIRDSS